MNKLSTIILITLLAGNVIAAGYANRIEYHYSTTVSTNVPALSSLVTLKDDSDGQGTKFTWLTAYSPSKATLDALDDSTVNAWVEDREADEASEMTSGVTIKLLKAVVLVFADETGNTPAQIKQKIKTKYKSLP